MHLRRFVLIHQRLSEHIMGKSEMIQPLRQHHKFVTLLLGHHVNNGTLGNYIIIIIIIIDGGGGSSSGREYHMYMCVLCMCD